jgi:nucleoside-diphosphate-sugar epimerase
MGKPTVLVTGISGFIGRHCAVELLKAGYGVRGTLRSMPRSVAVRESLARHADVSRLEFAQADLESDAGWDTAVAGCADVLHVASPFPARQPKDEQELIRPAVHGTLRVLRAASAGGVRRLVQTSSMVAVMYGHAADRSAPFTERDWTSVEAPGVTAYAKSKTLAERAAREFVAQDRSGLEYASVNPGVVFGPVLDRDIGTSAEVIQMMLAGKYPGAPRLSFPSVDVRDVARMHRLALESDAPTGGRYLCTAGTLWLIDVARALRAGLGDAARKAPTRELPDWLVRLVALVDGTVRPYVPDLGKDMKVDDTLTRRTLGMNCIPGDEAVVAMARSLLELKLA